ncbi:MAG TPA: hypothetical protein VEC18_09895 [Myxococcota bacterium]|nr:hypothetical protein [Myxococcota bacterium]
MAHFERLTDAALEHLRTRLLGRGWSSTEIDGLATRFRKLGFAARLAVLAAGRRRVGLLGAELIKAASQDVAFEFAPKVGVTPGAVQRFLREVLHRHRPLSEVSVRESEGEQHKRELFEKGVTALARRAGFPLSTEQVERVAALLATGEFFRDIGAATAAMLSTVRALPLAIARDIRFSLRAIRLLFALRRDLRGTDASLWSLFKRLRGGSLDDPPALLSETMRALYANASLAQTAEMIRTLLAKDNETFRLAIVIYARSAGVPIEDADLDVLRETVFNTDSPDLGPALVQAVERLEATIGRSFLNGVLDRL